MSKNLRIVFYGTPEIAAIELEYLVNQGYNIVGVVTNVDKPMGRGKKIAFSPVKEMALQLGVKNILQPASMKSEDFLAELSALKPDLQVVVAFRMMPKSVYALPPLGTFNLHTSLLPQYRGAAPINWAIINGEKETGITTFLLNDKIDCGEILLQRKIAIKAETDFEELYNEMAEQGKKLVADTIDLIEKGSFETIVQTEEETKPAPKIFKEDTYIDWHKNGNEIVNFIRGLCPIPAAKSIFIDESTEKDYEFKIFKAVFEKNNANKPIGTLWIENNKVIKVRCNDGVVELVDLQVSGKKRMLASELVKGLRINELLNKN
ncbi:MAG: methionyl-tRNA formyltransferase [Bacteroidales bacterium]|nr:methionyl-tRNA formyltransferase [Bacteroidales bacterium]